MKPELHSISGMRFIAIFHIFLHHLWAVYTYYGSSNSSTEGLLSSFQHAPEWLIILISNGWVSTSFFFMLSGFLLGYLYWEKNSGLVVDKKTFWIARFARIYPIHLSVLAILIVIKFTTHIKDGHSLEFVISSAVGSAMLIQAWIPQFIPLWSWPTWTISVLVFLYFITPSLVSGLSKLKKNEHYFLLTLTPFVSVIPAIGYWITMGDSNSWQPNVELFFSNFPLFWLMYFMAGLLLSRVYLHRLKQDNKTSGSSIISYGDIAFMALLVIACLPEISTVLKYFLRFGLLMPIYMMLILALASGKGILAPLMNTSLLRQLGDLSFSIFIWQAVVLAIAFSSIEHYPWIGPYQLPLCIMLILTLAYLSTHYFEKPITRRLKKVFKARHY